MDCKQKQKTIYAIPMFQEKQLDKACFGKLCGKVLLAGIQTENFGPCNLCKIKECPFEKGNVEAGAFGDYVVAFRSLDLKKINAAGRHKKTNGTNKRKRTRRSQ